MYKSVQISELQRAFALAHRFSTDPAVGDRERKYFRSVAHLIWKSCGEGPAPDSVGLSKLMDFCESDYARAIAGEVRL